MAKWTTTEYVAIGIAMYGAVLSTINSIVQIITHRKDRVDVILKVQPNMVITNAMHRKMTIITAVNKGKRPVTINGFAATQLDIRINLLFTDIRPQVPYQLTESQSISAFIPTPDGKLEAIETYFAFDNTDKQFKCHVASWHRRLLSRYRRRSIPIKYNRPAV